MGKSLGFAIFFLSKICDPGGTYPLAGEKTMKELINLKKDLGLDNRELCQAINNNP